MKTSGILFKSALFAIAGGLLVLVLISPASAQTRRKAANPAPTRTVQVISEANTPDFPNE